MIKYYQPLEYLNVYYAVSEKEEKAIILSSDILVKALSNCTELYVDGTFAVSIIISLENMYNVLLLCLTIRYNIYYNIYILCLAHTFLPLLFLSLKIPHYILIFIMLTHSYSNN